jgi:hypothetical protein
MAYTVTSTLLKAHIHHSRSPTFQPVSSGVTLGANPLDPRAIGGFSLRGQPRQGLATFRREIQFSQKAEDGTKRKTRRGERRG